MAQENTATLFVDDFYYSALLNQPETEPSEDFQVSDAMYAEELQLQEQEPLVASIESASNLAFQQTTPSTKEMGSSSGSGSGADAEDDAVMEESENFCEICAETREADEMVRSMKCDHAYCCYCISKHVGVKIQQNNRVVICPGLNCQRVLEAEECRGVVAREVMERWDELLVAPSDSPFKQYYSAMIVGDKGSGKDQRDHQWEEDRLLMELAEEKKWRRCPHCQFYVEKTRGCFHITCRCNYEFCYGCGADWTEDHEGCQP